MSAPNATAVLGGPLAHNTERSGPDKNVPVVIENPDAFVFAPDEREREWHEATDDEYAAYVAYWQAQDPTEQAWTFVGHWKDDRIIVEYVLPGVVEDDREDTGHWEQGLWAASGSGVDQAATMAAVIAEYEDAL